jgi:hypothetical protein
LTDIVGLSPSDNNRCFQKQAAQESVSSAARSVVGFIQKQTMIQLRALMSQATTTIVVRYIHH